MKKYISILSTVLVGATLMTSCKKEGCTDSLATNYNPDAKKDDGTCVYEPTPTPTAKYDVTFSFTHNYDGTPVTASDFNSIKYTNKFGNQHSITKLIYLISDVRLYKSNGDSVMLDGYNYIDLTNTSTLTYPAPKQVEEGTYTGISFIFGFDEQDNVSGAYADLNTASWNWPSMLGGGYHFMQFEGKYIDTAAAQVGFAYHMGTARHITATDTTFEANHFKADLPGSGFTLSNNATIEIKMNLAEWFKNPNTWDLNQYHSMLMPNYTAQLLMNDNGRSVFALGTITQ